MLEILQFYVSGFWVWLGITVGLIMVLKGMVLIVATVFVTTNQMNKEG